LDATAPEFISADLVSGRGEIAPFGRYPEPEWRAVAGPGARASLQFIPPPNAAPWSGRRGRDRGRYLHAVIYRSLARSLVLTSYIQLDHNTDLELLNIYECRLV
jgi:hypothetical protein